MPKEIFVSGELLDPNLYTQFPREQVSTALTEFGYGPSKKLVDSFYLEPNGQVGVGVLTVTEEHCLDHFGVFRGFDQAEAVGQTGLLLAKFLGRISVGSRPLLRKVEGFEWEFPVVEGTTLNMLVEPLSFDSKNFSMRGQVVVGENVVSSGEIAGRIAPTEVVERVIKAQRKIQANSQTIFPQLE